MMLIFLIIGFKEKGNYKRCTMRLVL